MESGASALSNAQIADHYANCIKLSSENVSLTTDSPHSSYVLMIACNRLTSLPGCLSAAENQCKECIWASPHRPHDGDAEEERRDDKLSGTLVVVDLSDLKDLIVCIHNTLLCSCLSVAGLEILEHLNQCVVTTGSSPESVTVAKNRVITLEHSHCCYLD